MLKSGIYTEEHEEFRRVAREFLAREIAPDFSAWDEAGLVPREAFQNVGKLGVPGMQIPEEYDEGGAIRRLRLHAGVPDRADVCERAGHSYLRRHQRGAQDNYRPFAWTLAGKARHHATGRFGFRDYEGRLRSRPEHRGGLRGLVHCAGTDRKLRVLDKEGAPSSLAYFEFIIKLNLVGSFNALRLGAARIARREPADGERGAVVMTASVAAL